MSLNDERGHSFEEEWPELARRLECFLAAKGVDTWLRADVVQETATRVYRKWPSLDHSCPLWNLVVTIALGVLVDERRKTSRFELAPDVPQPEIEDVETRALHLLSLTKARAVLEKMREEQRRVLLAEIGEAPWPEGTRNRINVLRLRARLALKSEMGPWAPAGVALRMRSLRDALERRIAEWNVGLSGVTSSIANLAIATTLVIAGASIDPPHAGSQASAVGTIGKDEKIGVTDDFESVDVRPPTPPDLAGAQDRVSRSRRSNVGHADRTMGYINRDADRTMSYVDRTMHYPDREANRGKRHVDRTISYVNGGSQDLNDDPP